MPSVDNRNSHYKTISQTCYIANIAYLALHVFYLILFIVSQLYVMMWITIGAIAFYSLCFLLIKFRKYYLYALLCGNEFLAFIIASTLIIGFATGFHFYLIGLSVVSFFTSYFSRQKRISTSVIWAALSLGIYLTLYFVSCNQSPYYTIDKWLEMTLFATHVIVVFAFIVFYLVVFLKYALSLEKKIMDESRTDELTQINNRYALYDYFAQLEDKTHMALALFDIDDFKRINDNHGHVVGDSILKSVASLAVETLSDCFVCRYGGEEFVVVLNNRGCCERLEELRKSIEDRLFEYEGSKFNITITIGVANYEKNMSLEKWVELADEKMYSGKRTGKNKMVS